jgi:hypothetical protein
MLWVKYYQTARLFIQVRKNNPIKLDPIAMLAAPAAARRFST